MLTYVVHWTAGINNYRLSLAEDSVGVRQSVNMNVVSRTTTDDNEVSSCVSVSGAGGCQHATWIYNVSADERGQPGVNTVQRQLTVSKVGQ